MVAFTAVKSVRVAGAGGVELGAWATYLLFGNEKKSPMPPFFALTGTASTPAICAASWR